MMPPDPNMPKVGDRVKVVVAPHMDGHDEGVVRQALHGALGIEFDAEPGVVHHWYVPSEVMVIEAAAMPAMDDMDRSRREPHASAEGRLLVRPVTLRAAEGKAAVLEGYAARFNEWTQIGGEAWGFMERIAPGAFADSLKDDDIRSFFNHDSNVVLGRTTAGTAAFTEDEHGLRAVIRPPDTQAARDVVTLIQRGDVTGMSFMFRTLTETWEEPTKKGELPKRTLQRVQLFEAGPVTFPAYESTSIAARDRAKALIEALVRPVVDAARVRDRARVALELELAGLEA